MIGRERERLEHYTGLGTRYGTYNQNCRSNASELQM